MVDYTPWLGPDWKPNWDKKNASMLICNHTSWIEIFYALHDHLPSFVARIGTKHTPIIGRFSDYLNSIYVDRQSGDSRTATSDAIVKH